MCQINEVVYVSLTISQGGLVRSKPPIPINDELVLVLSPLQFHAAKELIPTALLHGYAIYPLAEGSNQKNLVAPLTPSEYVIDEVWFHTLPRYRDSGNGDSRLGTLCTTCGVI